MINKNYYISMKKVLLRGNFSLILVFHLSFLIEYIYFRIVGSHGE
jgi:hypothetical protein